MAWLNVRAHCGARHMPRVRTSHGPPATSRENPPIFTPPVRLQGRSPALELPGDTKAAWRGPCRRRSVAALHRLRVRMAHGPPGGCGCLVPPLPYLQQSKHELNKHSVGNKGAGCWNLAASFHEERGAPHSKRQSADMQADGGVQGRRECDMMQQ